MKILENPLTVVEFEKQSEHVLEVFFIKAVVDIKRDLFAFDAPMHADLETLLIDQGSKQGDLWGINIHSKKEGDAFIEFDSMINLRPSWGNCSRGVDDENTQNIIIELVNRWIKR